MSKSSGPYSSMAANGTAFRPPSMQSSWTKIPPMYNDSLGQPSVPVQGADMDDMAVKPLGAASSASRRTRITRACDTCRRKKIKCDVDSDQPCSTCKQSGWECTFKDTAKKRGPPKGYIESLENRLKKMEKLLEQMHGDDGDHGSKLSNKRMRTMSGANTPEPTESNASSSPAASERSDSRSPYTAPQILSTSKPASHDGKPKVVSYHGSSSGYYLLGNILSHQDGQETDTMSSPHGKGPSDTPPSGQHVDPHKPEQYCGASEEDHTLIPSSKGTYRLRRMNVYDDDLMVVRDVTEDENSNQIAVDQRETIDSVVLDRPVLEGLVKHYFKSPHVTLPILEEEDYMNAFEGRTSPPPPPLLTLAICVYACFLMNADDSLFKEADLERDKVSSLLIEKSDALVRREYLTPRISTIQALVILCCHPPYANNSFRNWVLAGMAVRMAQELGLHRTLTSVKLPRKLFELRKRLWHSVYMTDRWCCAVMGHPLAISDADCDVELPETTGAEHGADYATFVHFSKLSSILGEVLRRIYSPKAKSSGYQTPSMEQTVQNLIKMLNEWYEQLPSDRRITSDDLATAKHHPNRWAEGVKATEGGPLTICYHAVTLLLLRPFIVLENEGSRSKFHKDTMQRCVEAAKAAIDVACIVPHQAIIQFGWNFAAYSVFQASLIHVYNCTSADAETAQTARTYIARSMSQCLAPLSEHTPSGPPVQRFLQLLLSLLRIDPSIVKLTEQTEKPSDQADSSLPHSLSQQQPSLSTIPSVPLMDATTGTRQPPPPPTYYTTSSNAPMSMGQASPMSVQQIVSGIDSTMAASKPESSWLLGGQGSGPPPSIVTQAAWQQLFSSAGTPFSTEASNLFDLPGWENLFFDQNSSTMNMYQ